MKLVCIKTEKNISRLCKIQGEKSDKRRKKNDTNENWNADKPHTKNAITEKSNGNTNLKYSKFERYGDGTGGPYRADATCDAIQLLSFVVGSFLSFFAYCLDGDGVLRFRFLYRIVLLYLVFLANFLFFEVNTQFIRSPTIYFCIRFAFVVLLCCLV